MTEWRVKPGLVHEHKMHWRGSAGVGEMGVADNPCVMNEDEPSTAAR